jgi:hypothetical protein
MKLTLDASEVYGIILEYLRTKGFDATDAIEVEYKNGELFDGVSVNLRTLVLEQFPDQEGTENAHLVKD